MNSIAVAAGYGVRIGLEDNYWFDENRTKLASNAMLLSRIRTLAGTCGREIMTCKRIALTVTPKIRQR